MPCKPLRNTTFFQNIGCLGLIQGESGYSGRNPDLDGKAKIARFIHDS